MAATLRGLASTVRALPAALACTMLVLGPVWPNMAWTNPSGADLVHGQADIRTSGSTLTVTNTPGAVIHWQDFSIGAHELTRFVQQHANSAVLNRVVGPVLSDLQGALESNGRVFLINPNGIAVGAGARIDTNGFVASTLGMTDADFAAGRLAFAGDGGDIINEGVILAHAGDVLLVAPRIENAGLIQAENGDVLLAAGRSVLVADVSLDGVTFEIQAPDDAVLNLGEVLADGTAAAFAGTLTQAGIVQASHVSVDADGVIVLSAGEIELTGSSELIADAVRAEALVDTLWVEGEIYAASVDLLGPQVGLGASADVEAGPGGVVHVGGNYLGQGPLPNSRAVFTDPASRISAPDGEVIVWSDEVSNVHGEIHAPAGFVETSSSGTLNVTRAPDVSGGGTWLLDPPEILIDNGGVDTVSIGPPNVFTAAVSGTSTLDVDTLTGALTGGVTAIVQTSGLDDGNIELATTLNVDNTIGTNTLQFTADNDVLLNQPITDPGGASTLNLVFQTLGQTTLNSTVNIDTGTFDALEDSFTGVLAGTGTITAALVQLDTLNATSNLTFNAVVDTNVLNHSAGTLTFNSAATVNTIYNWTGGTLTGGGSATAAGDLNISGAGDKSITAFELLFDSPSSTSIWSDGNIRATNGGNFRIANAAMFPITAVTAYQNTGGSASAIIVDAGGTLQVNPAGTFTVSTNLNNAGAIQVLGGTFSASGGGTHTSGTWVTTGDFNFAGGTHTLLGAPAITGSPGRARVNAGTTVIDVAAVATADNFTISGGTLRVDGNLTVLSDFGFTGGTLNSSVAPGADVRTGLGTLLVDTGAVATLSSTNTKSINLARLTVDTTAVSRWTDGQMNYSNAGQLVVGPSGTLSIDADVTAADAGGAEPFIEVQGTLIKDVSTGTATLNVDLNNNGVVQVLNGQLDAGSGGVGTNGAWDLPGGDFRFTGGIHTLMGTPTFTGANVGRVSAGTTVIDAAAVGTADNFAINGGTLQVDGNLAVLNSFGFTSGTLNSLVAPGADVRTGVGTLLVDTGAVATFSSASTKTITAARLTVDTTSVSRWTDGQMNYSSAGQLVVGPSGTLSIDADLTAADAGGAEPFIEVQGTLIKDVSTGSATLNVDLNNNGVVQVLNGQLDAGSGGVGTNGTWDLPGGDFRFNGGIHTLMGAPTFTGANVGRASGGTTVIDAAAVGTADNFAINGGTLRVDGNLAVLNSFGFTSGTLDSSVAPGADIRTGVGTLLVDTGAVATFSSASTKTVTAARLTVDTTSVSRWTDGQMNYSSAGQLVVGPSGTLSIDADLTAADAGGAQPFIEVQGTLIKDVSTGAATLNVDLNNNGVVQVLNGQLDAGSGGVGTNGTWDLPGGDFRFNGGTHTLMGTPTFTGANVGRVSGGTTVIDAAAMGTADNFAINGGTLRVDGNFAVLNSFGFTSGTLSSLVAPGADVRTGVGTLLVDTGAVATFSSASTKTVTAARLTVDTTSVSRWTDGQMNYSSAGQLVVGPSGTLSIDADLTVADAGGAQPFIEVQGTLIKDVSTGTATLNVDLNNNGVVQVLNGRLDATSGGVSNAGTWDLAGGDFGLAAGVFDLLAGSSATGANNLVIAGATVNIAAGTTFVADNVRQTGGVVQDGGTLSINNSLDWVAGTQQGSGSTIITAPATGLISSTNSRTLQGARLFQNDGTVNHTGTGTLFVRDTNVLINNGTWNATADSIIDNFAGSPPTLTNNGVFNRNTGTGIYDLDVNFVNAATGTVGVDSGVLRFRASADLSSTLAATSPGVLRFSGSSYTLQDGVAFTGNAVELVTGTMTALGTATFDDIVQSGGVVDGAGTVAALNTFDWQSGTQQGSGTTLVGPGSTLNLSTANARTLQGSRTLQNDGTLNHTGTGTLFVRDTNVLINSGTWNATVDSIIDNFAGSPPTLTNNGLFNRNTGTGFYDLDVNFVNAATGTVGVDSGVLRFRASADLSSTLAATSPGVLRFSGSSYTLQDGVAFTGNAVELVTGTMTALGTATFDDIVQSGGVVDGAGTITALNTFDWQSGTQQGSGTTLVGPGSTLNLSTANARTLQGSRTLQNDGTLNHTGTGTLFVRDTNVLINNGTWNATVDSIIDNFAGSPPTLTNNGAFNRNTGTGIYDLDVNFVNAATGTVGVDSGVLRFRASADLSSTLAATSPGVLRFSGSSYTLQDGVAFTGNAVELVTGTMTALGTATFDDIVQSGGVVDGAGTITALNTFDWQSGTQQGSGTTLVGPGSTLNLSTANARTLQGSRTLQNDGTLNHTGTGTLFVRDTNVLINSGTWNATVDSIIDNFAGSPPTLTNNGVFNRNTGTGFYDLDVNFVNAATGTVGVDSGVLRFRASADLSSTLAATSPGVLRFSGSSYTLQDGVAFTGNAVELVTGTMTALGTATFDDIVQSGGVVDGAGTVAALNTFDWQSGTQQGSGTTLVGPGSTLNLSTANARTLQGSRTLQNDGTLNHTGTGTLFVRDTNVLINNGTWNATVDSIIDNFAGSPPTLTNNGVFNRNTGTGIYDLDVNFVNAATGTVGVDSGVLRFRASADLSSTLAATSPGVLRFSGSSYTLQDGVAFTGNAVELVTGTMTALGTATFDDIVQSGGVVDGAGTVTASNFDWQSGAQQGSGVTAVPAGGTFAMSSGGSKTLQGTRTFLNDGTVTHSGGTLFVTSGNLLDNNGTWNINGDLTVDSFSGVGTLDNAGVVDRLGGTGTALLDVLINNTGTIGESAGGTLTLLVPSMLGGTFDIAGILNLSGSHTFIDGATLTGAGSLLSPTFNIDANTTPVSLGINYLQSGSDINGSGTLINAGTHRLRDGTAVNVAYVNDGTTRVESVTSDSIATFMTFTNNGVLQLENLDGVMARPVTLVVSSATLNNTGTVDVLQGPGMFAGQRFIDGRIVNAGGTINFQAPTQIDTLGADFDLTGAAAINVAAVQVDVDLGMVGLFTLADTASIDVASGGSFNVLNGGTVLAGGSISGAGVFNPETLTLDPDANLVLDGQDLTLDLLTIDTGSVELVSGTLTVNGNSTVNGTGTFTLTGGTFTPMGFANAGQVNVDAGVLDVNGGNQSGVFSVGSMGMLTFGPTAVLNDNTRLDGDGLIDLSSAVIAAPGGVDLAGSNMEVSGDIAGSGVLNLDGALQVRDSVTFAGLINVLPSGQLGVGGAAANTFTVGEISNDGSVLLSALPGQATELGVTTALSNGTGGVVQAVGSGGLITLSGPIDNSGLIEAQGDLVIDVTGTQIISSGALDALGSIVTVMGGDLSSTGTLFVDGGSIDVGGDLFLSGTDVSGTGMAAVTATNVDVSDAGSFSSIDLTAGAFTLAGTNVSATNAGFTGNTMVVTAANFVATASQFDLTGALDLSGGNFDLGGSTVNSDVSVDSAVFGGSVTVNGALALFDTLVVGAGASTIVADGVDIGGGTDINAADLSAPMFTFGGANSASDASFTGDTVLVDGGSLAANASQFELTGSLDVQDALVDLDGSTVVGDVLLAAGTLSGNFTVTGSLNNVAGVVSPGSSPGAVMVGGDFSQGIDGVLLIEVLDTLEPGVDFDQLQVTGTANLGGTLRVVDISPAGLNNVLFSPITFAAATGDFDLVESVGAPDFAFAGMVGADGFIGGAGDGTGTGDPGDGMTGGDGTTGGGNSGDGATSGGDGATSGGDGATSGGDGATSGGDGAPGAGGGSGGVVFTEVDQVLSEMNQDRAANRTDQSQRLAELSDGQSDLEGCDNNDETERSTLAAGQHGVGCR